MRHLLIDGIFTDFQFYAINNLVAINKLFTNMPSLLFIYKWIKQLTGVNLKGILNLK